MEISKLSRGKREPVSLDVLLGRSWTLRDEMKLFEHCILSWVRFSFHRVHYIHTALWRGNTKNEPYLNSALALFCYQDQQEQWSKSYSGQREFSGAWHARRIDLKFILFNVNASEHKFIKWKSSHTIRVWTLAEAKDYGVFGILLRKLDPSPLNSVHTQFHLDSSKSHY